MKPYESLIKAFEEERNSAENDILLQGKRDLLLLESLLRDKTRTLSGVVHFFPVSTERDPQGRQSAGVDLLDGDVLLPEFHGEPSEDDRLINLRCLINHTPEKQLLKRYGVEEGRDVIFFVPFFVFVEKKIVSEWRPDGADIGDLFFWDQSWYQAWNVHRESYFGQRNDALEIACICNRFRPTATPIDQQPSEKPFDFEIG